MSYCCGVGASRAPSYYRNLGAPRRLSAEQARFAQAARSFARTTDGGVKVVDGKTYWKTTSGEFVRRGKFINPKKQAKYREKQAGWGALMGIGADAELQVEPDYWMTEMIDEPERVVPNTIPLSWGNLGPNKPTVELPANYAGNLLKAWQVGGGAPVKTGSTTYIPMAPAGSSTGKILALAGLGLAAVFLLKKKRR